jgi:hypothetical protein
VYFHFALVQYERDHEKIVLIFCVKGLGHEKKFKHFYKNRLFYIGPQKNLYWILNFL